MRNDKIPTSPKPDLFPIPSGDIPQVVFKKLVIDEERLDLEISNSVREQVKILEHRDKFLKTNPAEIIGLPSVRMVQQFLCSLELEAEKAGIQMPNIFRRNLKKVTDCYHGIVIELKEYKQRVETGPEKNKTIFLKFLQDQYNHIDSSFKKFYQYQKGMLSSEDMFEAHLSDHFMTLKEVCAQRQKNIFKEMLEYHNSFFVPVINLFFSKIHHWKSLNSFLVDPTGRPQSRESNDANRHSIQYSFSQLQTGFDTRLEEKLMVSMRELKAVSIHWNDEIKDAELLLLENLCAEFESLTPQLLHIYRFIYMTSQSIARRGLFTVLALNRPNEVKSNESSYPVTTAVTLPPPPPPPSGTPVASGISSQRIWTPSSNSAFRPLPPPEGGAHLKRKFPSS